MAWIDDFLSSSLHSEICSQLLSNFGRCEVSLAAITLAAKTLPPTQESDVTNGIAGICTATGWKGTIDFGKQTAVFTII